MSPRRRSTRQQRRAERRQATPAAVTASAAGVEGRSEPRWPLALAAVAVLALLFGLRWSAPAPRSYDEYFHFALAREMWSQPRLASLPWTPFSSMYERFVDGAPLFHVLLMPFARLPLETAGLLGALLGQLFVVGSFAVALLLLRVPQPWWFLLALPASGTLILQRLEVCRPHVWLMGFSLLTCALLVDRRWWALAVACAAFGLVHTAGWVAIGFAAVWTLLGLVAAREPGAAGPRLPWQPLAAAAGGWLAGQLLHPQLPHNFRHLVLSGFVIPFQSTAAGDAALRRELGTELAPPGAQLLAEQWPMLLALALAVAALFLQPRLRRRGPLAITVVAAAFVVVGAVAMRRLFEVGAPLALLALALVVRQWRDEAIAPPAQEWRKTAVVVVLLLALGSTLLANARYDVGKWSPPRAMAQWLGEHGGAGDRVFTVQWADSGPLFYSAPQLQSIVALDPTVFHAHDPARFALFSQLVRGNHPRPIEAIREHFGARWVTVWKSFRTFGMAMQRQGAAIAYSDPDYVIFDLGAPPAGTPRIDPRRALSAGAR